MWLYVISRVYLNNVHLFECNILPFQERPYRICTHLTPPAAFNPRTLESRYKSPVTRRREYCEPRRCNAKVGTDLKYEFNSRCYNVDRVVNNIQELKRNVQDFDRPKCHDGTVCIYAYVYNLTTNILNKHNK